MADKKTFFDLRWLSQDEFEAWVCQVDGDSRSARCEVCRKVFSLSNMGEQALISHAKGKKHQQAIECLRKSVPISTFCSSSSIKPTTSSGNTFAESAQGTSTSASNLSTSGASSVVNKPQGITTMLLRNEVTVAEILWCLHLVMNHGSQRGGAEAVNLFPMMFPDSEIAKKIHLQRTKIGYTILFGIAPFFKQELDDDCKVLEYIVIGFDESLNKVSQKGQMDLFIRFWDTKTNQVITRYYNSSFLGHATAKDLLKSFREAATGLDLKTLLQVSMDGPNVNLKFLRDLKAELREENPDGPIPLNLGSCGLHQLHNGYKKGMKKTGWNIVKFLRSLYYLFCHSPARRDDYFKYSGSSLFPLKFCNVRWIENFSVAGRAVQIIPHVQKYVEGVKKNKREPDCDSYKIVCSALADKLLLPKLAFFQMMASDVEPFLTRFQTNNPMAPLLYEAIQGILHTVMSRFVKSDVLDSNMHDLLKIDLKVNENLRGVKHIDIGFAMRNALSKTKGVTPLEDTQLRKDCHDALAEFCVSLAKNSPLLYSLTKAISFFDPKVILKSELRLPRLTKALDIFVANNWLSGHQADKVKSNFIEILKRPLFEERMKNFSEENRRLDDLWLSVIPSEVEFIPATNFLKMVLILSHGNAFAERGFSINKEILVENLSEESLIAQRQVYDAVKYHGGISNIDLSKRLIHAARNSNGFYKEALQKKIGAKEAKLEEMARKRKTSEKIKVLEAKKRSLIDETRQQIEILESEMKSLR